MKLTRVSNDPILKAKPQHNWEAAAVFNAAAILDRGLVHLVYRATDITSNGSQGRYINSLGYAVSADGVHFNRLEDPILINDVPQEARGPEDPRVVKIDDVFYMLYTGYGGRFDGDYRICLASSCNLINWERHGVMLDEPNKDASLFPRKVNGKYLMFHRRHPDIWICESEDLIHWENHRVVMSPVEANAWEGLKIGISGPPIETEDGWLLVYHGVSHNKVYSQGLALLDKDDPCKVLARQAEPVLVPELDWEVNGYVPNVVFSCGQVVLDDVLYVYYAGADTAIGAATIPMKEIRF